jgi:hypothetical protein
MERGKIGKKAKTVKGRERGEGVWLGTVSGLGTSDTPDVGWLTAQFPL